MRWRAAGRVRRCQRLGWILWAIVIAEYVRCRGRRACVCRVHVPRFSAGFDALSLYMSAAAGSLLRHIDAAPAAITK